MVTTTRMSLEEFLALPGIDERRLELIDGEVYEKASPRWLHSRLALRIASLLDESGFAAVEPRAVIPPGGDRGPSAPIPDVAFYLADPPEPDDWMRRPPDIAVEVTSPGQSRAEARAKADMYLSFGVRSVWIVDTERESIDVYEAGSRTMFAGQDLVLTAVLPRLQVTVAALFDYARRR